MNLLQQDSVAGWLVHAIKIIQSSKFVKYWENNFYLFTLKKWQHC